MMVAKGNPHLRIWEAHDDIDPKFTKAITGKDYKGTSPNPQHVIWCLTDMFGPVGKGFGWEVLQDGFQLLGETTLHFCRIRFWWRENGAGDRNEFEAYGQTKAAYMAGQSGSRYHKVDEDAPKKSLTDAITKAASQLGIAANIFLGRWDDSKYVAQVARDMAEADEPDVSEAPPPVVHAAVRDRLVTAIGKCATKPALTKLWHNEGESLTELKDNAEPMFLQVKEAFRVAGTKAPDDGHRDEGKAA